MPGAATKRWAHSSRPFYATAFVLALVLVHVLFVRGPTSSRQDNDGGHMLSARSGEDCRLVHQAEDKCAFVLRNCHDDEAGLIEYLSLYYCTLGNAKPVAFIVLITWLCLLFSTIGIAASDFFSVNLSTIATILGLSQSLAGVTFLAFGNGSPDVFSTFAAMGSNSGSMAVGELLGAAGFITAVVAGSMALVREFKVSRNTFVRDIAFFIVAVAFTFYFIWDERIQLWECCAMIGYYVFYVIFVVVWHWYNKRIKARRARETASRSHFLASRSLQASDELEPYRDEPDDEEDAPGAQHRASAAADIDVLDQGPRIEIGEADSEDADDERNQHIAAEVTSSMRVNRPRGRRATTTITAIRPSLVGALEFRAVLASLQQERNMRMAPLAVRGYSADRLAVSGAERVSAVVGGPVSAHTLQGIGGTDVTNRMRSRSSGAVPSIMDEDLVSPRVDTFGHARTPSLPPHVVGGMLAPPPTDSTGGRALDHQGSTSQRQHLLGGGLQLRIPSPSPPLSQESSPAGSPFPQYTDTPMLMTPNVMQSSQPTLPTPGIERHSPFDDLQVAEVPRPIRWWPYRFLPDPHMLMRTMFPTLQDWKSKSIWDKLVSAWSVPSVLLLVITLPVVESETTDDDPEDDIMDEPATGSALNVAAPVSFEPHGLADTGSEWQQYRRHTRSRASSGTSTPAVVSLHTPDETHESNPTGTTTLHHSAEPAVQLHKPASDANSTTEDNEDQGWNRWLLIVQIFTGPMFAIFIVWANAVEEFDQPGKVLVRMVLGALVFSLVILGVLLATTSPDHRPKYHFMFCFLGFIIAIAWISTIAGEVVGVLKALGVIFDISEAILGLTVFAVGNSVGDLVADITVARLGYPVMALAACFGGPMLNILLGIGVGGAFQIVRAANKKHAKHPDRPFEYKTYHIQVGDTLLVSAIVVLITLLMFDTRLVRCSNTGELLHATKLMDSLSNHCVVICDTLVMLSCFKINMPSPRKESSSQTDVTIEATLAFWGCVVEMRAVSRIEGEKEKMAHIDWPQPRIISRSEAASGNTLQGPSYQKNINTNVPLLSLSLYFQAKHKIKTRNIRRLPSITNAANTWEIMSSDEKNKPRGGIATPNDPQEDKKKTLALGGEEKLGADDDDATRGLEEGGRDACCAGQEQHQHAGGGSAEYISRRGGEAVHRDGEKQGGESVERRGGGQI